MLFAMDGPPELETFIEHSGIGKPFFQTGGEDLEYETLWKRTGPMGFSDDLILWPTADMNTYEQLMLELVNRARANPGAEAARLGIDLNQGLAHGTIEDKPKPPLAPNLQLLEAARQHSEWMLETNTFSHTGSGGASISDRVAASGYPLAGWAWTVGENIAWGGSSTQVNWQIGTVARHEGLFLSPGHRVNICNGSFEEAGMGTIEGDFNGLNALMVTQKFARSGGTPGPFVTGAVYYDFNGEMFYQVYSGLEGIRVTLESGDYYTYTNPGGGYAIPFPSVSQMSELEFFDGFQSKTVVVPVSGTQSLKQDLVLTWIPTEISGPEMFPMGQAHSYEVNQRFGAQMYQMSVDQLTFAELDSPSNLSRVEDGTSESYSAYTTSVAYSGPGSYRFAHPDFENQFLTYAASFIVGENATIRFFSRLGWASTGQQATVQVSIDEGRTWQTVWLQTGTNDAGESTFNERIISLQDFSGERVRIRFAYLFLGGQAYTGVADHIGWFVDEVEFSNIFEINVVSFLENEPGEPFEFIPHAPGAYYLSSRPVFGAQIPPWGPRLNVKVAPASVPTLALHPTDLTVTAPDAAVFTVQANELDVTYQWQRSTNHGSTWSNISGASSSTYETGATTISMNGYRYRVLVSNSAGSVTSNAATLTVNAAAVVPSVTSQPVNQTVTAPEGATFSVAASGTAPLSYQWQRSTNHGSTWSNLSGATSESYHTGATTTAMNGYRYRVVVSNSAGSVTSNAATLTVNAAAVVPSVTSQPVNQTVTAPEGATFSVAASGTAPLAYQWQRSTNHGSTWSNLSGATSESYHTGATTTAMNGYRYRVVVSSSAGTTTSDPVTLTVVGGSTEVSRGAFGTMRQVDTNRFISDDFGELNFGGGGLDFTRAFSSSLQADLQEQNGLIFSDLYGVLRTNPWGLPQWIISDYFGLIHFGEDGDQYAGWVSSERFGWMRFVDAGGGDRFLWVHRLQTWMAVNPGGSFHSFDFGLLEPETGSLTRYNSRIGILIDDEFNPPGWLRNDRFGFVWFARDGTGVWFWSSSRNEWIGITPEGGLWSTEEKQFL